MNSPLLNMNPETLALDSSEAREAGRKFGESYRGKEPYPYGCIDNFLPEDVLNRVIADLETLPEADHSFDRAQEKCLIPRFDGVILSQEWKEALWDKFVTGAPRPRTPSELQYSDRKLRSRS